MVECCTKSLELEERPNVLTAGWLGRSVENEHGQEKESGFANRVRLADQCYKRELKNRFRGHTELGFNKVRGKRGEEQGREKSLQMWYVRGRPWAGYLVSSLNHQPFLKFLQPPRVWTPSTLGSAALYFRVTKVWSTNTDLPRQCRPAPWSNSSSKPSKQTFADSSLQEVAPRPPFFFFFSVRLKVVWAISKTNTGCSL